MEKSFYYSVAWSAMAWAAAGGTAFPIRSLHLASLLPTSSNGVPSCSRIGNPCSIASSNVVSGRCHVPSSDMMTHVPRSLSAECVDQQLQLHQHEYHLNQSQSWLAHSNPVPQVFQTVARSQVVDRRYSELQTEYPVFLLPCLLAHPMQESDAYWCNLSLHRAGGLRCMERHYLAS